MAMIRSIGIIFLGLLLAVDCDASPKHGAPGNNNPIAVPSLSSFSATPSSTSSDFSITADNVANGNLYWVVLTAPGVPNNQQIKIGQDSAWVAAFKSGNQAVSSTGTQTFTATGLSTSTTYYAYVEQQASSGGFSNRPAVTFTTSGGGGVPVLSSAASGGDGPDHVGIIVSTDTGSGTLYYVVTTNCTTPSVAQIQAGHDQGGGTPSPGAAGNQAVSATGQQSANPSGTIAGVTTYCVFLNQHAASGDSAITTITGVKTPGVLTMNVTGDAAFNAAQGGALAGFVAQAVTDMTSCFAPAINITVAVTYKYEALHGAFGVTFPATAGDSYKDTIRPALIALPGKNALQHAIYDNPPATDPTGLGDSENMTCAQYGALGFDNSFCASNPAWSTSFASEVTWDASNFSYVAIHENTEGLGRLANKSGPTLLDFRSYSAAGVRNVTSSGSRYPSVDGGTTNLISPFSYFQNWSAGDAMDWTDIGADPLTEGFTGGSGVLTDLDVKDVTTQGWPLTHDCRVNHSIALFP